jgi:AdoMet-dependent heme synthase
MSVIEDLLSSPAPVLENGNRRRASGGSDSRLPLKGSDFRLRPLQVTWQMTQDCEWKPVSPKAVRRTRRTRREISTAEAFHLIDQVAAMHVPLLALTGGDPLCRSDLFPVIEFACRRSVRMSLTLLPTPKVDDNAITALKELGLMRIGVWLHGSTSALHDRYSKIDGSYRRTLEIIERCHEVQLPVHVNTTVARSNTQDIDPMLDVLTRLDVAAWNVFFFVPANAGEGDEMLTVQETEQAFGTLYRGSGRVHFQVKTTEAPHYQRYILQQLARESKTRFLELDAVRYAPQGVNDSRGFVFVDSSGEVYPSRFLPLSAGNVTEQALSDLYCNSSLFSSLRDGSRLKGKCCRCPVRGICGGSRARAYAITGDLFAAEPTCAYEV